MSPIGRIFIVLNLALAGGFIYFSGVYLRNATDWKAKHDTQVELLSGQLETLDGQFKSEQANHGDTGRQLSASVKQANLLETQVKEKNAEIEQLSRQLNAIQAEIQTQAANYSTISSSIDTATSEYQDSTKMAIQAGQTRDEAVRAAEVARADLRDANDRIAAQEAMIAENTGKIAQLEQTIKEKNVLLELVQDRMPGFLANVQPDLKGMIERVDADGKLVTILVTEDLSDAGVKPGYSFAIYAGGVYKGEALVQDVDGKFAFCRVTRSTGSPIRKGDEAATITSSR